MYAKLFSSIYQGTLRGQAHEILVFTNLLATSDSAGFVDKHFRAIAEEVGLTQDEVRLAIANLEKEDPYSRSQELGGARIERLEEHRDWGWRVVNYVKYRNIKDTAARRDQLRAAQRRRREKLASSQHVESAQEAYG